MRSHTPKLTLGEPLFLSKPPLTPLLKGGSRLIDFQIRNVFKMVFLGVVDGVHEVGMCKFNLAGKQNRSNIGRLLKHVYTLQVGRQAKGKFKLWTKTYV
jgi:hypothetical protein